MAYFDVADYTPTVATPDSEEENRRKVLAAIAASGKPSVLGRPTATAQATPPAPRLTPTQPPDIGAPTFAGTSPLGTPTQPTRPPQPTPAPSRLTPAEAPSINIPPSTGAGPVLGQPVRPARPDVMPTREDFPTKPVPTWEKVLGIAAAPFLPNLTTNILGRPQREAEQQYRGAVGDWERQQTDAARAATTAEANARAQSLLNPKPDKPENLDREAYDFYVGQGMNPAAARKQVLADAQQEKPTKSDTATQEDQRFEGIRTSQRMNRPVSPEDAAWAKSYAERKTLAPFASAAAQAPQKGTERSDKSFQFNNTALDKVAAPVDQITQRMGRLTDTLNQNSPQADALVAPELLSVMSGGQGSGLRMNEAEIARIVGGRSNWESLKASINKWKLDPNAALSITPDQRAQIRALTKTVQDKLTAKQKIIDDARDALINADDPKDHRRIVADSKKKLDAIDAGGGGGPQPGDVEGGYRFKGGDPSDRKNWEKAK